jgi:pyruvate dehydrogenase E1 component alpha subunit
MGDQRAYRTHDEIRKWQDEDPIGKFEKYLLDNKVAHEELDKIDDEVKHIIDEAVKFADESPFPGIEEIWTDIYADIEPERI